MPKKDRRALVESAARADALANLLEHIGWAEHLEPEILAARERLVRQHVDATLGKLTYVPTNAKTAAPLKPEHLAGKIYGIDFVLGMMRKILTAGEDAQHALQEYFN